MTNLLLRDPFLAAPSRLLDELLGSVKNGGALTGFTPQIDVWETDDEYLVTVDLPGVKPGDVSIEMVDHVLTVSGARAPLGNGDPKLAERPYGSFLRRLTLPKGVDSDAISASYDNGVLTLHIAKPAQHKPHKIEIAATQKALAE